MSAATKSKDAIPVSEKPVQNGFMDQISAREDEYAWEGHYVTIDTDHAGVKKAYKEYEKVINEGRDDDAKLSLDLGNYGVYLKPATVDPESGRPVDVVVRLRDATNALITVPYESLTQVDLTNRR